MRMDLVTKCIIGASVMPSLCDGCGLALNLLHALVTRSLNEVRTTLVDLAALSP